MAIKNGQRVPRDSAKTTIKSFAGVLCLLGIVLIYSACEATSTNNLEYTFVNKSSYSVSVIFGERYKTKTKKWTEDGEKTVYVKSESKTLSVYSGSESVVYFDSQNVDFQWATGYANDVSKVYCTTSGAKATFRDR